ncbi:MAG TPA: DedA family protein [Actinomycetota bacterium]|nr:DedA family protein [Actinomycetota bacterium]
MFEALERFMTEVIGDYGYYAVVVLMILESACIPIPSEVTMVFGGFLVSRGRLDFFWVGMLGTLANVLGSWLAYWVGLVGGRPLIERWGKYIFLRKHELDRAEIWFEKHGEAAVFVSRLLPVVRTFISLPAGVAKMPFVKFTVYTFLGCLPWTFALTWAGFLLGENWETFLKYGEPVSIAIGVILLGVLVWWLVRRARARTRASLAAEGEGGAPDG